MSTGSPKIRVLSWSDIAFKFSQRPQFWAKYEQMYPQGVGPAIAAFLNETDVIEATGVHGQADELYHLERYDVLIAWGHGGEAKTDWEAAVDPAVRQGQLGLIPLHSIWNRGVWPNITTLSGVASDIAKVREDIPLRVERCIDAHPILDGVDDFDLEEDEIYFEPIELAKDVTRLLIGQWQEHTSPFAWARQVDQGRVFYLQPGHETNASYYHPMMQRLLINGVQWVAPIYAA